jgi:hypothetical protein
MLQGFTAGCGLEVTLKIMPGEKVFEFVKPSFYAGLKEEWEDSERGQVTSDEEMFARIKYVQDQCRKICEDQVDKDIYDIKEVKLFAEVLKMKGEK